MGTVLSAIHLHEHIDPDAFGIVAQYLDVQSLGRLSCTCKSLRTLVCSDELAWMNLFGRLSGDATAVPGDWASLTWRGRVEKLVRHRNFEGIESGTVFSFGAWRIFSPPEPSGDEFQRAFFSLVDGSVVVEVVFSSNGWTRLRHGGRDFVLWSSVSRSKQRLWKTLDVFIHEKPLSSRPAIPICCGAKFTKQATPGTPEPRRSRTRTPQFFTFAAKDDVLVIDLPSLRGPNQVFLPRADPGKAKFHDRLFPDIPRRADAPPSPTT